MATSKNNSSLLTTSSNFHLSQTQLFLCPTAGYASILCTLALDLWTVHKFYDKMVISQAREFPHNIFLSIKWYWLSKMYITMQIQRRFDKRQTLFSDCYKCTHLLDSVTKAGEVSRVRSFWRVDTGQAINSLAIRGPLNSARHVISRRCLQLRNQQWRTSLMATMSCAACRVPAAVTIVKSPHIALSFRPANTQMFDVRTEIFRLALCLSNVPWYKCEVSWLMTSVVDCTITYSRTEQVKFILKQGWCLSESFDI